MKPEIKKLILLNAPYLIFVYLFDKLSEAFRLAAGADLTAKFQNIAQGFSDAFDSMIISFHPIDLLIGVAGAAATQSAKTVEKNFGRSQNEKNDCSVVTTAV